MMFISRLALNPQSRQVQSELRDPYQMHRTLAKAFGPGDAWQQARCLFRVDIERLPVVETKTVPVVWVQACRLPHWEWLTVAPDYLSEPPDLKESKVRVRVAQRLNYRIRVNPTVKRGGRRAGLYTANERHAWWQRKSRDLGARIVSAHLRDAATPVLPLGMAMPSAERATLEFRVPLRDANRIDSTRAPNRGAFSAAQFDGELIVTDPDLLRAAMETGIGPGKAFGFGMLSIAKC